MSVTAEANKATVQHVLLIGKADGASGRFATLEGVPGVFVVGDALAKAIDRPVLDLLDRDLLKFDPSRVTKVRVAEGTESVTVVKDGNSWKAEGAPTFPIRPAAVGDVVGRFADLKAESILAFGSATDDAKYGPYRTYTLTATDPPATHVVRVGKDGAVRVGDAKSVAKVTLPPGFPASRLDFADTVLWELKPTDITGLTRTMGGAELAIENLGTAWDITKPTKEIADLTTMDELANELARPRADRIAAIAPKDLKPFGLDAPSAELAVATEKGKPRTLKIGGPVKDAKGGERYALAGGSDLVAVLPGELAKQLLAPPAAFRDRTLSNFVDADRIEIERGDRKTVFVKSGGWRMVEPAAAEAEDVALRDVVGLLARLRADEVVKEKITPADLKMFGLEVPKARWRLLNGDREVLSLLVGDGGHVKLAKGDTVYRVNPSVAAKLTQEYRKRSLFANLDVAQAEVIAFNGPGATLVLRRTPAGWVDQAMPRFKIDQDKVSETLDAIARLQVERFAADDASEAKLKEFGLNPPEAKLIVTTPTGAQVLDVGRAEGGSKRLYVRVPGKSFVGVVGEADVAKVWHGRAGFEKLPDRELIPVPPKERE